MRATTFPGPSTAFLARPLNAACPPPLIRPALTSPPALRQPVSVLHLLLHLLLHQPARSLRGASPAAPSRRLMLAAPMSPITSRSSRRSLLVCLCLKAPDEVAGALANSSHPPLPSTLAAAARGSPALCSATRRRGGRPLGARTGTALQHSERPRWCVLRPALLEKPERSRVGATRQRSPAQTHTPTRTCAHCTPPQTERGRAERGRADRRADSKPTCSRGRRLLVAGHWSLALRAWTPGCLKRLLRQRL